MSFKSLEIKLWLDDERPEPVGWYRAKTYDEAVELLTKYTVTECSLDHDLGWCDPCKQRGIELLDGKWPRCAHTKTGYDVLCWMQQTGEWPTTKPLIHTRNSEASVRMAQFLETFYTHKTPLTS